MSLSIINHWKHCKADGGHGILLGFQYSKWANAQYARQLSLEICLLGFGFEFKGRLGMSEKMYHTQAETK